MNNPPKQRMRRWSFIRPSRSNWVLLLEAFAGVAAVTAALLLLPLRYSVQSEQAAPVGSSGIYQLGSRLPEQLVAHLQMRDPAAVLGTSGPAGYQSLYPKRRSSFAAVPERLEPVPETGKLSPFQMLPESAAVPALVPPEQSAPLPPAAEWEATLQAESGAKLAVIPLPEKFRSPGGQSIIRGTRENGFFRAEILCSCGDPALDRLACRQLRKLRFSGRRIFYASWPLTEEEDRGGKR